MQIVLFIFLCLAFFLGVMTGEQATADKCDTYGKFKHFDTYACTKIKAPEVE
jgi:hypothetical protein